MPKCFAALTSRESRSYVEITSNTGLIGALAVRDAGKLLVGQLPNRALFLFLHEATHHWCFDSPLGMALASLYYRAVGGFVSTASADDKSDPAVQARFGLAVEDMLKFEVAFSLLLPLIEGLALFCEYDCQPDDAEVMPRPFADAAHLFCRTEDLSWKSMWAAFKQMLNHTRDSPELVERKVQLLLGEFVPSRNPYLSGYLTVRRMWDGAACSCDVFSSSSAFLLFLRNYVFEDAKLISLLLKDDNRSFLFAGAIATRIRDRLKALFFVNTYKNIAEHFAALAEACNRPPEPLHVPSHPAISLSDQETVNEGFAALTAFLEDVSIRAEAKTTESPYLSPAAKSLSQRDILVLDVSTIFVRITTGGVCSIWPQSSSATPDWNKAIMLGYQCPVRAHWGKSGMGIGVMIVSYRDALAFCAYILKDELVCDTLPESLSEDSKQRLRSIAEEMPNKLSLRETHGVLGTRSRASGVSLRRSNAT